MGGKFSLLVLALLVAITIGLSGCSVDSPTGEGKGGVPGGGGGGGGGPGGGDAVCGNAVCEKGENAKKCPADCGDGGSGAAACSDNIDNDGDGFCDFAWKKASCSDGSIVGDSDCTSKDGDSEGVVIPKSEVEFGNAVTNLPLSTNGGVSFRADDDSLRNVPFFIKVNDSNGSFDFEGKTISVDFEFGSSGKTGTLDVPVTVGNRDYVNGRQWIVSVDQNTGIGKVTIDGVGSFDEGQDFQVDGVTYRFVQVSQTGISNEDFIARILVDTVVEFIYGDNPGNNGKSSATFVYNSSSDHPSWTDNYVTDHAGSYGRLLLSNNSTFDGGIGSINGSSSSLVAHYDFTGGTANNKAGSNHDGIFMGNPVATNGKVGQGYLFDGVDDYIRVPDHPDLDFSRTFTISGWFHFDGSSDIGNTSRLIAKEASNDWSYNLLTLDNGAFGFDDAVLAQTNQGSSTTTTTDNQNLLIFKNDWVFLAATFDNGSLSLYRNGVLLQTVNGASNLRNSAADLGIGATGDGQFPFKGKIDEVRIHSTALTAQEILDLYNFVPAQSQTELIGEDIVVDTIAVGATTGVGFVNITKDGFTETYNEGETIQGLDGTGALGDQLVSVKFVQLIQTGAASITYKATFELYDEVGNLVDTRTVGVGVNLREVFALPSAPVTIGLYGSDSARRVYYAAQYNTNDLWLLLDADDFGAGQSDVIQFGKKIKFLGTSIPPNDGSYNESFVITNTHYVPKDTDLNSSFVFASADAFFVAQFEVDDAISNGKIKVFIDTIDGGNLGPFLQPNLTIFTNDVVYNGSPSWNLRSGTFSTWIQEAFTEAGTHVSLLDNDAGVLVSSPES